MTATSRCDADGHLDRLATAVRQQRLELVSGRGAAEHHRVHRAGAEHGHHAELRLDRAAEHEVDLRQYRLHPDILVRLPGRGVRVRALLGAVWRPDAFAPADPRRQHRHRVDRWKPGRHQSADHRSRGAGDDPGVHPAGQRVPFAARRRAQQPDRRRHRHGDRHGPERHAERTGDHRALSRSPDGRRRPPRRRATPTPTPTPNCSEPHSVIISTGAQPIGSTDPRWSLRSAPADTTNFSPGMAKVIAPNAAWSSLPHGRVDLRQPVVLERGHRRLSARELHVRALLAAVRGAGSGAAADPRRQHRHRVPRLGAGGDDAGDHRLHDSGDDSGLHLGQRYASPAGRRAQQSARQQRHRHRHGPERYPERFRAGLPLPTWLLRRRLQHATTR